MCDPRQIHTPPHMHTLRYKRICQAPTLYTCKSNGLQYPQRHNHMQTHTYTGTQSLPKTCISKPRRVEQTYTGGWNLCSNPLLYIVQHQCFISVIVTCVSSGEHQTEKMKPLSVKYLLPEGWNMVLQKWVEKRYIYFLISMATYHNISPKNSKSKKWSKTSVSIEMLRD